MSAADNAYGREPVEYVFVNVDTGVAEVADSAAYLVELGPLSDSDAELLNEADHFGAYSELQVAVVRRVGVPVSELIAAWQLLRSGVVS